ncbi:MAG: hypothetical protein QM725_06065 [Lacibacter sp.]
MKRILNQLANGYVVITLMAAVLFFNLVLFPSAAVKKGGQELRPLDLRMQYSLADVTTLFDEMGSKGRSVYYMGISIIDSIYPVIYTLLLISLFTLFLRKLEWQRKRWQFVLLLPLLIMLADFTENFNTLYMLRHYPSITEQNAALGSAASSAKWIVTGISFLLLITGFVFLLIRFLLKKSQKKS